VHDLVASIQQWINAKVFAQRIAPAQSAGTGTLFLFKKQEKRWVHVPNALN